MWTLTERRVGQRYIRRQKRFLGILLIFVTQGEGQDHLPVARNPAIGSMASVVMLRGKSICLKDPTFQSSWSRRSGERSWRTTSKCLENMMAAKQEWSWSAKLDETVTQFVLLMHSLSDETHLRYKQWWANETEIMVRNRNTCNTMWTMLRGYINVIDALWKRKKIETEGREKDMMSWSVSIKKWSWFILWRTSDLAQPTSLVGRLCWTRGNRWYMGAIGQIRNQVGWCFQWSSTASWRRHRRSRPV